MRHSHHMVLMTDRDDDAAKRERGDSILSPIPIILIAFGGFATLVMAKAAWDLLRTYGGI